MTFEQFNDVVHERLVKINNLMEVKRQEYSRDGDRFSNFKRAAALRNCSPETALVGMWVKHLVSVMDMVNDMEHGEVYKQDKWDEKLNDVIIYTLLLDGLLQETKETPCKANGMSIS